MVRPDERIEAGDLLVFRATDEGIAAIWRPRCSARRPAALRRQRQRRRTGVAA
jgi:hypothetical protein